ncbi:MAG: 1-acyl-sn-glycerol-3-phosphate acyltransferase [Proteobacteria bacterium]|jgi:1-acyl-sn-glycerol-3-phosphate acyltransferase|nr:1-acyl-sn-glycerol-3-phosphate acyltransferase [Pseudomonadota bacterium]
MGRIRAAAKMTRGTAIVGQYWLACRIASLFPNSMSPSERMRLNCPRLTRAFGLNITIEGSPPSGPALLVSNHLSYMDIIVLSATAPVSFVAAEELGAWPFLGQVIKDAGTLFVNRSRRIDIGRVVDKIEQALKEGRTIVIFPEGTTGPGAEVRRFHSGLLEPAARLNMPVHTATIRYKTTPPDMPAYRSVCWWEDISFPDHFRRMMKLRGRVDVHVVFGDQPIGPAPRKQLALQLRQAVQDNFEPLISEPPPGWEFDSKARKP